MSLGVSHAAAIRLVDRSHVYRSTLCYADARTR